METFPIPSLPEPRTGSRAPLPGALQAPFAGPLRIAEQFANRSTAYLWLADMTGQTLCLTGPDLMTLQVQAMALCASFNALAQIQDEAVYEGVARG